MIPVIASCPSGTKPYVIQAGDTFYNIAHRFNTTVQALIMANPTVNPNMLMIGQRICVPMHPVPQCPGGTPYTIKAGDTFYAIAMANGVSVEELMRFNPGVDPNRLYIGQIICIPPRPVPPTCPAGTQPYTIQAGDTFFSIAQRYNVTVEALLRANPTVNPNALYIGQVICIPSRPTPPPPATCPTGTFPHTVVSGDTYFRLAQRYNTTVEAIRAANPGVNPDALQIGQVICIPGTPTPPPPPPSTCPAGTTPHTVVSGDTYYRLAQRYNTTVEAIRAANPGVNPDNLQIGQIICIPGTPTPPPPPGTCPAGTFPHTVVSGDTYYRLAQRYNTTVEAIRAANPGVNPDNLQIGQRICIPGTPTPPPSTCPAGTFAYTVVSGDTYYRLAIRYNTTVEAIRAANPGVNPDNLRVGQVICIPRT